MTANSMRFLAAWLLSVVLFFRAGDALLRSFAARKWLASKAVVTESDARWVEHGRAIGPGMLSYQLHLRYRYTIEDRPFVGTRFTFSPWGPTENFNPFNSSTAQHFPVGSIVTAFYDPADHSRSVLRPRPSSGVWLALIVAIGLGQIGYKYGRRAQREKQNACPTSLGILRNPGSPTT